MTIPNLLAWAAQSLTLVAVAALMPLVLRVRSARAQLILLQAVLFGMVALPLLQPWKHPVYTILMFTPEPSRMAAIESVQNVPLQAAFDWELAVWYTLAAGVIVRGTWLALGVVRLRRYRRYAEALTDIVAVSSDVTSPVTFGVWRPVVLVPPMFLEMPQPQQQAILAHEMLHVRRRDWLFCVAEEIAASLMWFHPAVWFLLARIRTLREQVVDSEVVAATRDREPYVEALLTMAQARPMLDVAAAPLFLRTQDLTNRVKTILEGRSMSIRRILCSYACVGVAVAAAVVYSATMFPLVGAPMQNESESRGRLTRIDTFSLPQPLRSQVEARLDQYRNAPFTSEMMMRVRGDIAAMDSKIVQNWIQESQDSYSVSFSYPTGEQRTVPVLVRIDTSRLPDPLRSHVEARVSSFVNAPFTDALMNSLQSAVTLIDRKIAYRWNNEPGGNMALTFLYDVAEDWQTVHGVLSVIDVSRLPEPVRTQMEQRLAKYRNAPYTNAMMSEIKREAYTVSPRAVLTWSRDRSGVFSLTISDEPPSGTRATPLTAGPPEFPSGGEKQIRIGGAVQAQKLRRSVPPVYPPLALQARIQGVVRFHVQIGKDGRVKAMQLISGHPLMVQAARDALMQYEYDPTLLDGEPVQVVTQVDVNFTLN